MRVFKTLLAIFIPAIITYLIYWLSGEDFTRSKNLAYASSFAFMASTGFGLICFYSKQINCSCEEHERETGKEPASVYRAMFSVLDRVLVEHRSEFITLMNKYNPERNVDATPVPKLDPALSGGGIIIGNQSNGGFIAFGEPPKTRRPRKSKAAILAETPPAPKTPPEDATPGNAPITPPIPHTTEAESPGLNLT